MTGPRLIVVCGYSDGRTEGLHEICAGRVRRAEREAGIDDVVLLTGWARRGNGAAEGELMARSWKTKCGRVAVDTGASSTIANMNAAANLAREVDAREVRLVTSSWHARRARALLRVALRGVDADVRVAVADDRPSVATRLRELGCWALVPLARLKPAA